jgi:cellulose synthase/poly-beta-1,6-N-acetylglucosamine synthase-like glycosyltransferase
VAISVSDLLLSLFLLSAASIIYGYLGFPLLVALLARQRRSWARDDSHLPAVTFIISAYNEESVIREKLENTLRLDYPKERLQVLVASESTDRTNAIAGEYADRGIRLCAFDGRMGKSATIQRVVPDATGDILVFSDANAIYRPEAIRRLVRNFADRAVGCVIGQLLYRDPSDSVGGRGETIYWRYDQWLRSRATKVPGFVPGINGSVFAIRRRLFFPFTIDRGDDYELCTRIAIRGHAAVFEPEAIAEEIASETTRQQFRRKVRLVRWNIMSSWLLLRDAIAHGARMTALQVFSNRLIRYSVPCWLLLMLFTSAALSAESRWFAWILIAQVAFYLVAGLGWAADAVRLPVPKMLLVPAYFVMVNSAAALAIAGLSGGQVSLWTKQR